MTPFRPQALSAMPVIVGGHASAKRNMTPVKAELSVSVTVVGAAMVNRYQSVSRVPASANVVPVYVLLPGTFVYIGVGELQPPFASVPHVSPSGVAPAAAIHEVQRHVFASQFTPSPL